MDSSTLRTLFTIRERNLLQRMQMHDVIHVIDPERQVTLMSLEKQGYCRTWSPERGVLCGRATPAGLVAKAG